MGSQRQREVFLKWPALRKWATLWVRGNTANTNALSVGKNSFFPALQRRIGSNVEAPNAANTFAGNLALGSMKQRTEAEVTSGTIIWSDVT